jgi:hypothetical protein
MYIFEILQIIYLLIECSLLQGWCPKKKYDLNAVKCKSLSYSRGSDPVLFQYVIGDSDLERVDEIHDFGVPIDL